MLNPQTYSASTKYIEEVMQTDRQSDRQTDAINCVFFSLSLSLMEPHKIVNIKIPA